MIAERDRLDEWVDANPVIPRGDFEKGKREEQSFVNQGPHHSAREKIGALEAALERINAGTFGVCIDCGSQIQVGRLMAYPYFSRCTACQRKKGVKIY